MALAVSTHTLPVYEIYKVGAELAWTPGPRTCSAAWAWTWRSCRTGTTTRAARSSTPAIATWATTGSSELQSMLPAETVILAIDEHTACVVDLGREQARVHGNGSVSVIRGDEAQAFARRRDVPALAAAPVVWLAERGRAGLPDRRRAPGLVRDPAVQDGRDAADRRRLRKVVVHAGGQALVADPAERVRRQRDDRRPPTGRLGRADRGGRLVAVEVRHLAVHQDRGVRAARGRRDRLVPVGRRVDGEPEPLDDPGGDLAVDRVVVHHQDRQPVRRGDGSRLTHGVAPPGPHRRPDPARPPAAP